LAERIIRDQEEIASELGVDPNVVEAACLAHDLGHPPFGHVAEDELNKLADDAGSEDGFEGNAQSFRVVTKLSVRREGTPGLDLTRATLNAILKYPWVRGGVGAKKKKWGAYSTEIDDFKWARRGFEHDDRQSAEAALMDIADDIAYSVHDMADFFRAGKLPLDRLVTTDFERDRFFDHITKKHPDQANQLIKVAGAMFDEDLPLYIDQPFNGSISQRSKVKSLTSLLIGRYVSDVELQIPKDDSETTTKFRDEAYRDEIAVLKELTWCYVIADNSLGLQQLGQRKIIQGLFKAFRDAVDKESWHLFPRSMRAQLESLDPDGGPIRVVTDLIAGMDEEQAASTYQQVTGISLGSGLAAILR
jgi:dGTPase